MRATKDLVERIRFAESFVERCQAWHLVHTQYGRHGFTPTHPSGMLFSALDLLPSSVTVNATVNGRIVGTMSATVGPIGYLPSGFQFEEDLSNFGIDGRLICEFTKLAVEENDVEASRGVGLMLMAFLLNWCRLNGVDDAFCVTHPKHAIAWNRIFGWEPVSRVKNCGYVGGNLGILLHRDVKQLFDNLKYISTRGRNIILKTSEHVTPGAHAHRITGAELAVLLLQRPELFSECNELQKNFLSRYYPWASLFCHDYQAALTQPWRPLSRLSTYKPPRELAYCFTSSQVLADTGLPKSHLQLLVINNDPYCQRFMSRLLTERQHYLAFSNNVGAAYRQVLERNFDAVLFLDQPYGEPESKLMEKIRCLDNDRNHHTILLSLGNNIPVTNLRSNWAFSNSAPAVLIKALEVIGNSPTEKPYQRYAEILDRFTESHFDQAKHQAA